MKDNYQDFNDDEQKDSLTFPKFNTNYDNNSETNSVNNNIEEKNKIKNENNIINNNQNDTMKNNIAKLKESIMVKDKNIEMKEI